MDIKAFNRKRMILGIACAPAMVCALTYPWRAHVFGQYQNIVLVVSISVGFFVMYFNGPTLDEVQEYREKMMKDDADKDAE
jgi:hypothetical protein